MVLFIDAEWLASDFCRARVGGTLWLRDEAGWSAAQITDHLVLPFLQVELDMSEVYRDTRLDPEGLG